MACIIKANTIVIYDFSVVNYATNSGVTMYAASVIFCQLKILDYDASVVFTTLQDFHNSEQYDASIASTTSYFYSTGHWNLGYQSHPMLRKREHFIHKVYSLPLKLGKDDIFCLIGLLGYHL